MLELHKIFLLVRFFNQISCNKGLKTKISCFYMFFLFENIQKTELPLYKFPFQKIVTCHDGSTERGHVKISVAWLMSDNKIIQWKENLSYVYMISEIN